MRRYRSRLFMLLGLLVLAATSTAKDFDMEENFLAWPVTHWSAPGTFMQQGWRFFGVGGAQGGLELIALAASSEAPGPKAVRLTRMNTAGDLALDLDTTDSHILVSPGERLFVRVWARRGTGSSARLDVRLAEFHGSTFLGNDNDHKFLLTDQFTPCAFQVAVSTATTEVEVALRLAGPETETGTGAIEVCRIEVGPVESAAGTRPVIELPQGWTPVMNPTLYWRGPTPAAYQVQLARDLAFTDLISNAAPVEQSSSHWFMPDLAAGQPTFARVRVRDWSGAWSDWSDPTVVVYQPLPVAPGSPNAPLVTYDLSPARALPPAEAFEQSHLVSALQGLVNRQGPRLFVRWSPGDDDWLARLRQPNHYLEQVTVVNSPSLEDLLTRFAGAYRGVVLWDPAVPATSNVASTVAGADNLLPVPLRDEPRSLYQRLVKGGPKLPVVVNLTDKFTGTGTIPDTGEASSGSAKNDAYRWAIARYLETGKCNPAKMGYYLDAWWINGPNHGESGLTVVNHDYFIREKGFIWDLDVWPDETPVDDPRQAPGTDKATLLRLFKAAAGRLGPEEMIHVGGFTPWDYKYTDAAGSGGRHGGVPTEWETARLLSQYNAFLDADAPGLIALANASLYANLPKPPRRLNQAPPPTREECVANDWLTSNGQVTARNFILHYIGDYDSAAWMMSQLPERWASFRRGRLALPWAWDPNLMERAMPMFDEYLRTRTPRDVLWAGDNGAGYLNPGELFAPRESGLLDGSERWQRHNMRWFRLLDLRHAGFVISGSARPMDDACRALYARFAGDGIVDQFLENDKLVAGAPVIRMKEDNGADTNPAAAADRAVGGSKPGQTRFVPMRSILRDPEFYWQTNRELARRHADLRPVAATPAEFFYLLRINLGGANTRRAAFLYDTVPTTVTAGATVRGRLWLRNIGWDSWATTGPASVRVAVELTTADRRATPALFGLPQPVAPGRMVEVPFTLAAPANPGPYHWRIDLVEGETGWFSDSGNLEESRMVEVQRPSTQVAGWSQWP